MKYAYPANFTKDDTGYLVQFPDLKGCMTEGKDLKEAIKKAEEALGGYIASMVERGLPVPAPSDVTQIPYNAKLESIVAIYSHADRYFTQTKAVKKTLTIPLWLNTD